MSRIIIMKSSFVDTIPVDRSRIGPWQGTNRADVVKALYSFATEGGLSVVIEGAHWPELPASPEVMRMASNKLSRGFMPKAAHVKVNRPWEGI